MANSLQVRGTGTAPDARIGTNHRPQRPIRAEPRRAGRRRALGWNKSGHQSARSRSEGRYKHPRVARRDDVIAEWRNRCRREPGVGDAERDADDRQAEGHSRDGVSDREPQSSEPNQITLSMVFTTDPWHGPRGRPPSVTHEVAIRERVPRLHPPKSCISECHQRPEGERLDDHHACYCRVERRECLYPHRKDDRGARRNG